MNPSIGTASRGLALAALCLAQFMVALDIAVTNVALPSIQSDLDVPQDDLQWVVTAYGLILGGFLMLGGRLADLRGRKPVLMAGLTTFALASLAAGLAPSFEVLVVARGVQGLGAAMTAPAALSILTTIFAEGEERNRALGIWGAMGASGAAAGVLLSGIITDTIGWEWIFFINIPVGILLAVVVRTLFVEERAAVAGGRLDVPGAVSLTASLLLLVYGLEEAVDRGWGDAVTLAIFVASALLFAAFIGIESRSSQPLVRLGIFRTRTFSAANAVNLSVWGAFFGFIFVTSLYMQQVMGWSALRAGFAWLPFALLVGVAAGISSSLVAKVGVRPLMACGLGLLAAGLLLMTRVSVGGSYAGEMLPAFLLGAVGLGCAMVSAQVAVFSGVREQETGLASGVVNTTQEVGGALGVAVQASVALTVTNNLARGGADGLISLPAALTDGFQAAYAVGAVAAGIGLVLALALVRAPRAVGEAAAAASEKRAAAD